MTSMEVTKPLKVAVVFGIVGHFSLLRIARRSWHLEETFVVDIL